MPANPSQTLPEGWVTGFAGENRVAPDHALPPNVSPDALNIDYLDGTLKKRPGLIRQHKYPMTTGGMLVGDGRFRDRYAQLVRGAALNFGGSTAFEYEFAFLFDAKRNPAASESGLEFNLINDTNGNRGIKVVLLWNGTNWRVKLYMGNSAAAFSTVTHSTNLISHTVYAIRVQHTPTGSDKFAVSINGVTVGANFGGETFLYNNGANMKFGQDGLDFAPTGLRVVLDDLRFWTGTAHTPIIDASTGAYRAMTTVEVATETTANRLLAYWRLDTPNASNNWESSGGTFTTAITSTAGVKGARGLVLGGRASIITGMAPVFTNDTESGMLVCTEDAIYLLTYSTASVASVHLLDEPSLTRWSFARHSGYLLLANGSNENLRYSTAGGIRHLSFMQPATGATATVDTGSGDFPDTGVVKYLFSFYDSLTGQESFVYTGGDISATLANTTDEVTLSDFPITDAPGVTSYKIYRTDPDGAVFYPLKTIDYFGNTEYVDDNVGDPGDGSIDSSVQLPWHLFYQFKGYAEPSIFLLEFNGCVLACNQSGFGSRIRFTEPATAGDFYDTNYFWAGLGDGDVLTGGLIKDGMPILFKRSATWFVVGTGRSTFAARRDDGGAGCWHHATIGSSPTAVFFEGPDGVYALQGGIATDLTENTQRPLFADLRDDERLESAGLFDGIEQRYYVRLTLNGNTRTLVFDNRNNAWALWDLAADCFALARPDGGTSQVMVGCRGYVSRISRTRMDDGATAVGSTVTTTSFTTIANGANLDRMTFIGNVSPLPNKASGGNIQQVRIKLNYPDGTSEIATVAYTDDTTAWFVSAVTGIGGAIPLGTVVWVEPIASNWRTARQSYDNGIDDTKAWERLRVLFQTITSATLAFFITGQAHDETDVTQTFDMVSNARIKRQKMEMRGGEIIVGFSEESPDKTFNLAAYQAWDQKRNPNP